MEERFDKINDPLKEELNRQFPGFENEITKSKKVVVTKKQALDTYSIRSRINSEKEPPPLIGYESLVANLETFQDEMVAIHSVMSNDKIVILFTDADQQKIIGYLSKYATGKFTRLEASNGKKRIELKGLSLGRFQCRK